MMKTMCMMSYFLALVNDQSLWKVSLSIKLLVSDNEHSELLRSNLEQQKCYKLHSSSLIPVYAINITK